MFKISLTGSKSQPKSAPVQILEPLTPTAVIWQLLAFSLVVLPLLWHLPNWISVVAALAWFWRWGISQGRIGRPHWSLRLLLLVGIGLGVLLSFSRSTSLDAFAALLVLSLSLKLLEIQQRRDALVLLYVASFTLATAFLFEQSLVMGLYSLAVIWVWITALVSCWQSERPSHWTRPMRQGWRLFWPALPLMLLLFLLFPRIGPLWSVTLNTERAQTGLSDQMSPGEVSQLTRSAELAFRAVFAEDQVLPTPSQRYWRALVYSEFDGRSWTLGTPPAGLRTEWNALEEMEALSAPIDYEIMQERSGRLWMFALDLPQQATSESRWLPGRRLEALAPIDQRRQYRLSSVLEYRLAPQLSEALREYYLRLPPAANPRSRALAQGWWQAAEQDPQRFIQTLLDYFNQSFIYTLEPPRLPLNHAVDAFLLETQRGFCEHYAGASAWMLRSVGIPARVVAGYQGGEWNEAGRYFTLRQYDAHAWVEVWLEGEGWRRLDPTAAVAPERIEQTADLFFADEPSFMADAPLAGLGRGASRWMFALQRRYDAVNFQWHRWVLNYHEQQADFLRDLLGGVTPWRMILALLIPAAVLLFAVWLGLYQMRRAPRGDALERAQKRLFAKLARQGQRREAHESLAEFARRMAQVFPEQAPMWQSLATADERWRYAPDANRLDYKACLTALKQCIRRV
ncbi:transglutaminase TgpA family protein [Nitrincola tapanii]|uniref:DUF3488 domain-containing protein n=1 Tax=Nitrincola tapanii TaxID=1708751 RepID=A0A5A9VZP3_9GAMM|nr:DUF3488 and transglutaminase-like domain-containing protein [Nitrincola tapanii]KAA0873970.1 DUF3488 domain-containing protein [Nitrincola tapanii]